MERCCAGVSALGLRVPLPALLNIAVDGGFSGVVFLVMVEIVSETETALDQCDHDPS